MLIIKWESMVTHRNAICELTSIWQYENKICAQDVHGEEFDVVKYATEEKAQEVMEMIEGHIGMVIFNKMHGNSDVVIKEVGFTGAEQYIFAIPKD